MRHQTPTLCSRSTTTMVGGLTYYNVHLYTTPMLQVRRHRLKRLYRQYKRLLNQEARAMIKYNINVATMTIQERQQPAPPPVALDSAAWIYGGDRLCDL